MHNKTKKQHLNTCNVSILYVTIATGIPLNLNTVYTIISMQMTWWLRRWTARSEEFH